MSTAGSNTGFAPVLLPDYKERISYDPNGNIQAYLRNGNATRLQMDDLTYHYKAGTNQLDKVADAAPDAAASDYDKYKDLKQGQQTGNYTYDAIGNLISDASEGVSSINWTVYGKIASVTKSSGTTSYSYDASGNRISKATGNKQTFYVRDASGNVMGVYEKETNTALKKTESHLYGSSRLGIAGEETTAPVSVALAVGYDNGKMTTFTRGETFFELSNHLGNVLVTVSDRKLPVASTTNSSLIDYYLPDVVSAQDYYPFGMTMPGRKFSSGKYRYGFNGKEDDPETGTQDYGMRIYNPTLGRFLSVDPLQTKYPYYTPYQFSGNKPIWATDLDGLEEYYYTATWDSKTGTTQIHLDKVVNKKSFLGITWKPSFEVNLTFKKTDGDETDWTFTQLGTMVRGSGPGGIDLYQNKAANFDTYKNAASITKYTSEEEAYKALDKQFYSDGAVAINIFGSACKDFHDHGGAYTLNVRATNQVIAANSGNKNVAKSNTATTTATVPKETMTNGFDRSSIGGQIAPGKQAVHIPTTHQYKNNVNANKVYKSVLTTDAQSLLNEFRNGSGTILENNLGGKSLLVRFDRPIGNVIDQKTGAITTEGTHYGAIKYGTNNVHITPVNYTPPK